MGVRLERAPRGRRSGCVAPRPDAQIRDAPEVPEAAGDEAQTVVQGGDRDLVGT